MNNKGFGLVGLLIAVLLIALLSGGVFYGYKGGLFGGGTASSTIIGPIDAAKKAKDLLEKNNQEVVQEVSTSSTADWRTYRNEEYGFEFKYPKDVVVEINNKNDAWYGLQFKNTLTVKRTNTALGDYKLFSVGKVTNTKEPFHFEFSPILYREPSSLYELADIKKNCPRPFFGNTKIPSARSGFADGLSAQITHYIVLSSSTTLIISNDETDVGMFRNDPEALKDKMAQETIYGQDLQQKILKTFSFFGKAQPLNFECTSQYDNVHFFEEKSRG